LKEEGLASNMIQQMAQGKQPTPEIHNRRCHFGIDVTALHADRKSLFGGDLSVLAVCCGCCRIDRSYTKGQNKGYYALCRSCSPDLIDLLGVDRRYLGYKNFVEPVDNGKCVCSYPADLKIKADTTKYSG